MASGSAPGPFPSQQRPLSPIPRPAWNPIADQGTRNITAAMMDGKRSPRRPLPKAHCRLTSPGKLQWRPLLHHRPPYRGNSESLSAGFGGRSCSRWESSIPFLLWASSLPDSASLLPAKCFPQSVENSSTARGIESMQPRRSIAPTGPRCRLRTIQFRISDQLTNGAGYASQAQDSCCRRRASHC